MSRRESGSLTLMHVALIAAGALMLLQLAFLSSGMEGFAFSAPELATQLGVSAATAYKLMDMLGSWYFTILIAAATGGWGAGLVAIAKSMAVKYGKKYAGLW